VERCRWWSAVAGGALSLVMRDAWGRLKSD
jgi:hypothetical protein